MHIVTGANGRTGAALCAELKKRGHFVRAFIRPSAEKYRPFLAPHVDEFVYGDIRDASSVEKAFSGAAVVYHLAAIVSIASRMTREIEEVNIHGTHNVIAACKKNHVGRLVYTGTVHTLPFYNNSDVLREIPRFKPEEVDGPYAVSKSAASNLILDAAQDGLNTVIGMPSGIVGGFEYKTSNFGQMVRDVCEGRLGVYLKGRYDFVDVRDVVSALADLAEKGAAGESFILSGHTVSVKDLVGYAAEASGRKPPALCIPRPIVTAFSYPAEWLSLALGRTLVFTPYAIKVLGDNCHFSHEKISALTGYAPRPIRDAIAEQVDFYMNVYKPHFLRRSS
ncbi:MAG: NAD-dependent epimerase/dehydratase family protein [Spirochaetaceae bacterium]|nr:NAD-dependent epimerase/dehydratase family protein [Spirochaetaceae bacterium]